MRKGYSRRQEYPPLVNREKKLVVINRNLAEEPLLRDMYHDATLFVEPRAWLVSVLVLNNNAEKIPVKGSTVR
jgi:hypothetical protein